MISHRFPRICPIVFLLVSMPTLGDVVPFRLVVWEAFDNSDIEAFDSEASDVWGLRIGIFNSVNKTMYGISVTGLADGFTETPDPETSNFYDDDWAGLKIGGIASESVGSGYGIQIGGFGPNTEGRMTGIQIGGLGASCGILDGIQVSGAYSSAEVGMVGIQIGGIFARIGEVVGEGERKDRGVDSYGIQMAAFTFADELSGVQMGAFNRAYELSGVQMGAFNHADTLCGLQIGIVNQARDLTGVQIGLVNISGDVNGGDFRFLPILNARF